MGLNASNIKYENSGNKQDPIEAGNYPGRLVQAIDLGLQPQQPFKNVEKPPAYEVMLTYELVTEFMKDEDGNDMEDKPRWISESFVLHSLQADRAKSTQRITTLDPGLVHGGNLGEMMSLPCTVTVVRDVNKKDPTKFYTNVANITPPMKGFQLPPLKNKPVTFDLGSPDLEVFSKLPEWVQKKICSNLEFQGSKLQEMLGGNPASSPDTPEEESQDGDSDNNNPY